MKIQGKTQMLGILGWPVEHSFSPHMQNAAIRATGLDACYVPLPCSPENLEAAVQGLRVMGFTGANVTIPHKSAVIPFLDKVDEEAKFTNSVNTIYRVDGKLHGCSTDAHGAVEALRESGVNLAGRKVVLIGAGGAAKALSWPLAMGHDIPESFHIAARSADLSAAEQLASSLAEHPLIRRAPEVLDLTNFGKRSEEWDLVIHATPVGMSPNTETCVLKAEDLRNRPTVMDIVYNPRDTALLQLARKQGCNTVEGLGMLLHQGAVSFRKWFGVTPDVKVMREALLAS